VESGDDEFVVDFLKGAIVGASGRLVVLVVTETMPRIPILVVR